MSEGERDPIGFTIGFVLVVGPLILAVLAWLGVIGDEGDSNEPISPYPDTCYEAPYGQVEC